MKTCDIFGWGELDKNAIRSAQEAVRDLGIVKIIPSDNALGVDGYGERSLVNACARPGGVERGER